MTGTHASDGLANREWARRPAVAVYHYAIVVLMIAAAILGGTSFDGLQIACEATTIILLAYGLLKVRWTGVDAVMMGALVVTSLASFFWNDFVTFALNFKMYLLCLLTLMYFRKVRFLPHRLVAAVFVVNALLIIHQYVAGEFILPTATFFGYYQSYMNSRPVGLFLTPHASSFFVAICMLYTLGTKPLKSVLSVVLISMTGTLTNLIGVIAQATDYVLRKLRAYRRSFGRFPLITYIIVPLAALYFMVEPFLELLRLSSYTRYYSAEIILPQLFDPRFFREVLRFIPANYADLTVQQEESYAQFGNEIGLVKVFVEGGLLLGGVTLWAVLRELRAFRLFTYFTLLHYAMVINTPFFLFLMIAYNRDMPEPVAADEHAMREP
ncbi:MAG: hypothetical protein O2973_11890 [Gemmatimonadetes bacterium]|nr:hypothetical protein [Gemmatimonadota bacterium]